MKNKISIAILFLVTSLFLTSNIHDAHACSCAAPTNYSAALTESKYAFTGTVTHIDNSLGPQKVYFDVISVTKGDIPDGKFLLENTGIVRQDDTRSESSCDVGYHVGTTYNVFVYDNAFMNNDMWSTKTVEFLGVMNPLQYDLFFSVILVLMLIAIIIIIFIIKRKKDEKGDFQKNHPHFLEGCWLHVLQYI